MMSEVSDRRWREPFPGAVRFAGGSVSAVGGHLTWEAYASAADPKAVFDHYWAILGDAGLETSGVQTWLWRLGPGDGLTTATIGIMLPDAGGPHRENAAKMPADTRTVVVVSSAVWQATAQRQDEMVTGRAERRWQPSTWVLLVAIAAVVAFATIRWLP